MGNVNLHFFLPALAGLTVAVELLLDFEEAFPDLLLNLWLERLLHVVRLQVLALEILEQVGLRRLSPLGGRIQIAVIQIRRHRANRVWTRLDVHLLQGSHVSHRRRIKIYRLVHRGRHHRLGEVGTRCIVG